MSPLEHVLCLERDFWAYICLTGHSSHRAPQWKRKIPSNRAVIWYMYVEYHMHSTRIKLYVTEKKKKEKFLIVFSNLRSVRGIYGVDFSKRIYEGIKGGFMQWCGGCMPPPPILPAFRRLFHTKAEPHIPRIYSLRLVCNMTLIPASRVQRRERVIVNKSSSQA